MAKEIERKFLIISQSYRELAVNATSIKQAYLNRDPDATVRVRVRNGQAWLTVKGRNHGMVRDEWEYAIPTSDAEAMIARCARGSVIDKTRYVVPFGGYEWEVDEFHGAHSGLTVAEIELPDTSTEFPLPPFVGEEVTGDPRYYNSNL